MKWRNKMDDKELELELVLVEKDKEETIYQIYERLNNKLDIVIEKLKLRTEKIKKEDS